MSKVAIERIRRAVGDPYHGVMYEGTNTPRLDDWINGFRKSDWDKIIAPVLRSAGILRLNERVEP